MSTKKKTQEEAIADFRKVHGDRYQYGEYVNNRTKMQMFCSEHGEFWQTPKQHLRGQGCPICGKEKGRKRTNCGHSNTTIRKMIQECYKKNKKNIPKIDFLVHDQESFLKAMKVIFGGRYDFSKSIYKNRKTKVIVICPEHGEFERTASDLLKGKGCKECSKIEISKEQSMPAELFFQLANEKYNGYYDYSDSQYIDFRTKLKIICPEHGEFWQTPKQHLRHCGCIGCVSKHKREMFQTDLNDFIKRATEIHHGKYTYELITGITNVMTSVMITCPEHGPFPCSPANHLKGRGCPICKAAHHVYESRMALFLETIFSKNDIIREARTDWLTNRKSLDFYIPKYHIAIEHQGSQHFKEVPYLNHDNPQKFKRTQELDKEKYTECQNNGITLLYFTYENCYVPNDYIDKVYTDENEFKNKILNIINN